MKKQNEFNIQPISANKMALIAQKGMGTVRLTKEEKRYLLAGGLEEINIMREAMKETVIPLEDQDIEKIRNWVLPEASDEQIPIRIKYDYSRSDKMMEIPQICLRLRDGVLELVKSIDGDLKKEKEKVNSICSGILAARLAPYMSCLAASASTFTHRGDSDSGLRITITIEKRKIEIFASPTEDNLLDMCVRLKSKRMKPRCRLDVSLYEGKMCITSFSSPNDNSSTIRRIRPGDYMLQISEKEGNTTFCILRFEH